MCLIKNKKIIIFGTGSLAEKFIKTYNLDIFFFLDNDSKKWNNNFFDKKIIDPSTLKNYNLNDYFIIIASSFYNEISLQLELLGAKKYIHYITINDVIFPKNVNDFFLKNLNGKDFEGSIMISGNSKEGRLFYDKKIIKFLEVYLKSFRRISKIFLMIV